MCGKWTADRVETLVTGDNMSTSSDTYRAAYALIDQFGANAAKVASNRAAGCEASGCKESAQTWLAIQKAVERISQPTKAVC